MKTIFLVGALLGLLFLARSSEALTCSDVVQDLKPCISFLQSGNGVPPPPCCSGVKALAASATSTQDKKTACGCLKSASKNLKFNGQGAQAIPKSCGVSWPYPISPSFDCNSIQ